ncbi:hypothetical protein [Streptomyces sp. NBC_01089]|uniref:hypothetical protein n=1 Tax=Streptomyces sp. NBC_01089 TaxID=2903747 RepID=UPI00386DD3B8|nr:hypothetical protein OG510_02435 [Streptomyces sp. NBC_01089]
MRSPGRFTACAAALATTAATIVISAGSPAAADGGGYWAWGCDDGRACIQLSGSRRGPGGAVWNVVGCGSHQINDYYDSATAHGNHFIVTYRDDRWDRVDAWTSRGLDPTNLATNIWVYC